MSETKSPTHKALQAVKRGERTFWNELGAAWPHKDGKGMTIKLSSLPLDGEVILREIDVNAESGE